MLMEQCLQEDNSCKPPVQHELAPRKEPQPATIERQILVAADAVLEDKSALERAEKLRDALGFTLRFLPAAPDTSEHYDTLLRESAQAEVALIVLPKPPLDKNGHRDPRWHAFCVTVSVQCWRSGCAVSSRWVVAASDCSDPSLPVVHEARIVAAALGSKLILVHNVDPVASQFAERVGLPMSTPMADMLALHLREQLELVAVDSEVVITRDEDNARGVLNVANAQRADLIIVGVKPQEVAPHGTADTIIDAAQQSVLYIPLPASSKSVLLD